MILYAHKFIKTIFEEQWRSRFFEDAIFVKIIEKGILRMKEKSCVTEIFGSNVFNDAVMSERLPKKVYAELKKTIEEGKELTLEVADVVAHEMKEWAIEKGATHYTHWFQPMTGITAEKHDSFISPKSNGKAVMSFSGKELIKGEPDASSFPSGGLRATFEARGYTAWDCTSPAFLREDAAGLTLCIPTAFTSYTGECLDKKTPLLRSMEAISTQAMRVLKLFGNNTAKKVITSVGPEQEYFLVDRDLYLQREDLMLTGRTLFGAPAAKGQEMEDHYFGTLKERVSLYMKELNNELWKLGVTAKTQHNEVAPAQHELAPIYATTNIATDHNQLIMEVMKRVAGHHNLTCLLHEKPFAGINGSGKHNNWSMVTNEGENLLEPGDTPHKNKQFLLFLAAVLAAVDDNAALLRVSAANPGNDHRLGANEAPPAIISVFLGDQLEDILEQIEKGALVSSKEGGLLDLGVHSLPTLIKDATDRNRTSPFAFTGNKFEFRMVPSSASISGPNIVLNAIVADTLSVIADQLEKAPDFNKALDELLTKLIKDHRRIVFNGNGYSEEWVKEAERRGLPNIKSMVEAIPALVSKKTVDLYAKHKIFTESESLSRAEMFYEQYIKTINIEAKTMIDMTKKQIMPAVMEYAAQIADTINTIKAAADVDISVQTELLKEVTAGLVELKAKLVKLEKATASAAEMEEDLKAQAIAYRDDVFAAMNELRVPADQLELIVDSNVWPFPTYADLLFRI